MHTSIVSDSGCRRHGSDRLSVGPGYAARVAGTDISDAHNTGGQSIDAAAAAAAAAVQVENFRALW
jgi:hypothetical protein